MESRMVTELISQYRTAATQSDELADSSKQNKAADLVHSCYKALRETEEGRFAIIRLLTDSEMSVRCWAAAHSLAWEPAKARAVLEAIIDANVFPTSFDAEMTLEEYDKGNLTFDH